VRVVCMDMSASYRALVKQYFPHARIVADRFHVIRLIQHHFMDLCRQIAPSIKQHRGYLAALGKHPERLTDLQRSRLDQLFLSHPALRAIYDQLQRVCRKRRKRCPLDVIQAAADFSRRAAALRAGVRLAMISGSVSPGRRVRSS
ncbi:MAG: transposase, partial [Akkermansiaceae bacterium]